MTLALGTAWTQDVYRRAQRIADDVAEYRATGFEIVDLGRSPSRGVRTTLDLDRVLDAMARCNPDSNSGSATRDIVAANFVAGPDLLVHSPDRALRSRGNAGACCEHDLVAQLADAGVVVP